MAKDEIEDQSEEQMYSFLDSAATQLEEAMKKMQELRDSNQDKIDTLETKIRQTESDTQAIEI